MTEPGEPTPDEMRALATVLEAQRAAPHPAFRGRLRRRLEGHGIPPGRPANLWLKVAAFSAAGGTLLLLAAIDVLG